MTLARRNSTRPAGSLSAFPRARAEAIEHGKLVDVTELAAGKRFVVPVALTTEVFEDVRDLSSHYILSSDSAEGRLDKLLHYAWANVTKNALRSGFEFSFYMPLGEATIYTADLRMMGGDDPGQSVITISKAE